jgi:isopentenyl-diphosphate Delta-isomerase
MAEFFDVFDENNQSLNQVTEREKVHKQGLWHRTSQVWVMNHNREILCNYRSRDKDLFPHHWDLSVGGHVESGGNYLETAIRELNEELSVNPHSSELIELGDEKISGEDVERNMLDREHAKLYLWRTDLTTDDFIYPEDEIETLQYFSIPVLKEKLVNGSIDFKVIPTKTFYLKILSKLERLSFD